MRRFVLTICVLSLAAAWVRADDIEVKGQVLGPDEKPVAGAAVVLRHNRHGRLGIATADAQGRFVFRCSKENFAPADTHRPYFAASAGAKFPLAVLVITEHKPAGYVLHVPKDDPAIEGRLVDLEGQPVRDVEVRALDLVATGADDLIGLIDALRDRRKPLPAADSLELAEFPILLTARTDNDGRFRLTGVGSERIVTLRLDGESVVSELIHVMTRRTGRVQAVNKDADAIRLEQNSHLYSREFTHALAPSAPVEGVVRDAVTKKPLAGIRLKANDFSRVKLTASTDRDGKMGKWCQFIFPAGCVWGKTAWRSLPRLMA
jgi:hypothetical protein